MKEVFQSKAFSRRIRNRRSRTENNNNPSYFRLRS
jgi:hypothetical protein